ncbi:MAG: hypothetical protein ACYCVD_03490 [Desulfitobacteriaceae bacterium]
MHRIPPLRPKAIRPPTRGTKANYFQMHVYDQERQRLEAERDELHKRLDMIEERVQFIQEELQKLQRILKQGVSLKIN